MHRETLTLVEQAVAGQPDAFGHLYRHYYPLVLRYSMNLTGDPSAAEDVTQDVFTGLLRQLARFDPARAALSSYLYGIVRNLARRRRRRDQRLLPLSHIDIDTLTTADGDPRTTFEHRESAAIVRRVLDGLPPRYRAPLLLCDAHGLCYVDAAVLLGITPAAVQYRVREGRSRARRRLNTNLRRISRPGGNHLHGC